MNQLWGKRGASVLGAAAILAFSGCNDDPIGPTCPAADMIAGVCAGVPAGAVCESDLCTDGVNCAEVISIGSDAELHEKAKTAAAGACLALARGTYTTIALPGGVSLLGRSAEDVKIDAIYLNAGAGAVVRGIAVGSEGIELDGATSVRIESVRVSGDAAVNRDLITLKPGASATIVTSTIEGAGRAGISATDADVEIDRCIVSGAQGGGVEAVGSVCLSSCPCSQRPALTVKNSLIRDNHIMGISAYGAAVSIIDTDVMKSRSGDKLQTLKLGGGIALLECSTAEATRLRVLECSDFGVLIDNSTVKLGDDKSPDGTVEISRNLRGLWIQNVVQSCEGVVGGCVSLHNGSLEGNLGVGIGVAGGSRSVILCRLSVIGTADAFLPVSDVDLISGKEAIIAHGVDWIEDSEVTIEALTLRDNAQQSLLIDGPASGNIMSLNLLGSDVKNPPLQQNLPMGDDRKPDVASGVTLTSREDRKFAVPLPFAKPTPP